MSSFEVVTGVVVLCSLWLFIRAFRKGIRYWSDSASDRYDDD